MAGERMGAEVAAETGELVGGGFEGLFDGPLPGEGIGLPDVIAVVVEVGKEDVDEGEDGDEGQ